MANLIKMDTDIVLNTMSKIRYLGDSMESMISELDKLTKAIPWQGSARDQYVQNFSNMASRATAALMDLETLSLRVQREVDEWIEVDRVNGQEYTTIGSTIIGIVGTIGKKVGEIGKAISIAAGQEIFSNWWKFLTLEQKKEYLKKLLEKISKRYGIPVIELNFPDLEDDKVKHLDALGSYDPNKDQMNVDITNLNEGDPCVLVETLAHELRHKYQNDCVREFERSGTIPDGMTQADIELWKNNSENYVSPDQDFEIYRNQEIEVDARNSGTQIANEFFANNGSLD